ncbi:erythromycin esterase family protein [Sediminibacterium sp.]|uniref:erythromycin esterase family protein n=1 Tax=Sediminibacterium sp. TaxID=1917865 RepID=UPI002736EEB7|nr:erythromycin esterase family protein [Sediminibacterium sp.]MDP3393020.1 erythromycin esterase family protein [Sediminibacterium sp.]MDP3567226.1 erythromycin esterase family protein [Sediminibacterium sp.]
MNKILIIILLFLSTTCKAQTLINHKIEFTSDLRDFNNLPALREILKDVEIIALGENTHGLGEVFRVKSDLVKFLHKELGFNLILFESGFGDGALAWEQFDSLSTKDLTLSFTSNFYYHSKEILELMEYVKSQDKKLKIQGFDCQPQQNFLINRMFQIVMPIDSVFAKSVKVEFRNFNKLYQYENDKDTIRFYKQRDEFVSFLDTYTKIMKENEKKLLKSGTTQNEIEALKKSNQIFKETYSKIEFGSMMGWPISANIRDKSLFETIKWFKENNPEAKIIIWAQNSHIENKPKPNNSVNWMGHSLKETYVNKYYSLGVDVYSGKNLDYNRSFDFEHNDKNYLAYHLNRFNREAFILNLRNYKQNDFINESLLGMESGGNTARFIAKERFDGILFVKYSNIPQLIKDK